MRISPYFTWVPGLQILPGSAALTREYLICSLNPTWRGGETASTREKRLYSFCSPSQEELCGSVITGQLDNESPARIMGVCRQTRATLLEDRHAPFCCCCRVRISRPERWHRQCG